MKKPVLKGTGFLFGENGKLREDIIKMGMEKRKVDHFQDGMRCGMFIFLLRKIFLWMIVFVSALC